MKKYILRAIFLILAVVPIIFLSDFFIHFQMHFTGDVLLVAATGQWHLVSMSIIISLLFLIPLSFRRRANWKEYGLVSAFFVSLFIEMYGIPLTTLLAAGLFQTPGIKVPNPVFEFTLLGVPLVMSMAMLYGTILMVMGAFFVLLGWITLYRNKNKLVTTGIYSLSRHPQYLGFILIVLGWFIGWPTILTAVFTPILVYRYVKVSQDEEKSFGSEYQRYAKRVPFLL
jgi:protein-S-isoprenylcysteine O-methyltransferase Ste14